MPVPDAYLENGWCVEHEDSFYNTQGERDSVIKSGSGSFPVSLPEQESYVLYRMSKIKTYSVDGTW